MCSELRCTEEDAVVACFKVHRIRLEFRECTNDVFQGNCDSALHECLVWLSTLSCLMAL